MYSAIRQNPCAQYVGGRMPSTETVYHRILLYNKEKAKAELRFMAVPKGAQGGLSRQPRNGKCSLSQTIRQNQRQARQF